MVENDRVQAVVNLNNIYDNVSNLKKLVKNDTKVMAIVKADGYGHGAYEVADYIDDLVDAYGVAMIEEAVTLREKGSQKMILILGYTAKKFLPVTIQYGISQTVFEYEMAKALSDAAMQMGKPAKIHIKLDTGMGRIGFRCDDESAKIIYEISKLPGIVMEGCFTHFSKADENDLSYTREQYNKYIKFVDKLEKMGVSFAIKHVCNSAGVMQFPEGHLDMVRFGIAMYGLYPSEDIDKNVAILKPAMELKTVISFVKTVPAGTKISYGGTYETNKETIVATIPIGYADGYPRSQSNIGRVLIHGQYAPIIGRVCMDQFMVDVTDIPDVKAEDKVTLIGFDGDNYISVEEVAEPANSFNYEFVCNVGKRVPRVYKN